MVKIVYQSLQPKGATAGKAAKLTAKRVKASNGAQVTVYKVDADSPNFGNELTVAFKRSVAKARRENSDLGLKAARVGAKA